MVEDASTRRRIEREPDEFVEGATTFKEAFSHPERVKEYLQVPPVLSDNDAMGKDANKMAKDTNVVHRALTDVTTLAYTALLLICFCASPSQTGMHMVWSKARNLAAGIRGLTKEDEPVAIWTCFHPDAVGMVGDFVKQKRRRGLEGDAASNGKAYGHVVLTEKEIAEVMARLPPRHCVEIYQHIAK